MIALQVISFLSSSWALRFLAGSWDLPFPKRGRGSPTPKGEVCDRPSRQSHAYLQQPGNRVAVPPLRPAAHQWEVGGERQTSAFRATLGHSAACPNRLSPSP